MDGNYTFNDLQCSTLWSPKLFFSAIRNGRQKFARGDPRDSRFCSCSNCANPRASNGLYDSQSTRLTKKRRKEKEEYYSPVPILKKSIDHLVAIHSQDDDPLVSSHTYPWQVVHWFLLLLHSRIWEITSYSKWSSVLGRLSNHSTQEPTKHKLNFHLAYPPLQGTPLRPSLQLLWRRHHPPTKTLLPFFKCKLSTLPDIWFDSLSALILISLYKTRIHCILIFQTRLYTNLQDSFYYFPLQLHYSLTGSFYPSSRSTAIQAISAPSDSTIQAIYLQAIYHALPSLIRNRLDYPLCRNSCSKTNDDCLSFMLILGWHVPPAQLSEEVGSSSRPVW